MYKALKTIGILLIIFVLAIVFLFVTKDESIVILKGKGKIDVVYKGIENGEAFDFDEEDNCYVAKENSIDVIYSNGESEEIIKDESIKIYSMRYLKNKLYYIDRNYLKALDLKTKDINILMDNLPIYENYNDGKILVDNENIYIGIGTVTNSGVSEGLTQYGIMHDLSPKVLTLNGLNFGEKLTGPFLPYGSESQRGQIINSNFPGNGVVIKYNLDKNKGDLFSWGIRNIKAWDTNSNEEIYSIIGGMEDKGLRPVKGDKDYIYKLEKNKWYGWPDYTGGEPINSDKFSNNGETINFVLDNHPTTDIPKPFYSHEDISSLELLAIDKNKDLDREEKIYFYDKNKRTVSTLSYYSIINDLLTFKEDDELKDMRIYNGKIYFLNNNKKMIFSIEII